MHGGESHRWGEGHIFKGQIAEINQQGTALGRTHGRELIEETNVVSRSRFATLRHLGHLDQRPLPTQSNAERPDVSGGR